MKRNFIFLTLFFMGTLSYAQDNERPPAKGLVTENPVMPTLNVYETIGTLLETRPGDNRWSIGDWTIKNTGEDMLFSTGKYEGSRSYLLESPVVKLPVLQDPSGRLNLYFEEWYELETYYDKGLIQVSENGGQAWQTISERSGSSKIRTSVINMSGYAGKTIQVRFHLQTDGSNNYNGWNILGIQLNHEILPERGSAPASVSDKIGTNARTMASLNGNLSNLDAQKFPRFIFANLSVNDGTVPLDNLDESNFSVIETINDSIPDVRTVVKDETFKVFAPTNDSISRPVDILFLMDNSGSMGDEQAQVAANVQNFVGELGARGFQYRLGLCRFGQGENNGNPIFHNNAAWYTDTTEFINVWNTVNTINGSREPSWDALYFSSQQYSFANAAQKIFILITDESITGNNIAFSTITDRQLVIDQLQSVGVTTYALVPSTATFDSDFGVIADSTGGRSYNILSPFNDILDDIGTQISNTYTVRYTPTKPIFDGLKRDVEIIVDYMGSSLSLFGDYTPGAAPAVFRTDATLNLLRSARQQGTPTTIEVDVLDFISPFPQNASLFYRTVSSGADYKEIAMTQIGTGTTETRWTATIPGIDVLDPGINYYVRVSDGQATTTAPEFIDREGYPWSFAVLPNLPPSVSNRTVTSSLKAGDVINFEVEATDNTNFVNGVWVYVLEPNEINFQPYTMQPAGGNLYTFNGLTLQQGLTEYYFVAEDDFGVNAFDGSELNPFTIATDIPWEVNTNSIGRHTINLAGFDFSTFTAWSVDAKMGIEDLEIGDYIGVFLTDGTGDVCAGFYPWNGPPFGFASFFAYGDDPNTSEKDGFVNGDSLSFKIFRKRDAAVYDADHIFRTSSPGITFQSGGSSQMESVRAFYDQQIDSKTNLNLWSTYLLPKSASFDDIFAGQTLIREVRDDQGNSWVPGGGAANTLTTYLQGYGYEVYADTITVVPVKGSKTPLNQLSISLVGNQQSTLIGCPYESPENVEAVFSGYASNVFAVDKYVNDGTGFISIESYSPMFAINNWVDKNMRPGEAYYTFALNPEPAFTFPAPTGQFMARKKSGPGVASKGNLIQRVKSVENYMHVVLPADAWSFTPVEGSHVRAYNMQGNLIGQVDVQSNGALLVLDGWAMKEEAAFQLRLWSPVSGQEQKLEVINWRTGAGVYANHKAAVAGSIFGESTALPGNHLQIYPNPTEDQLKIAFTLEDAENTQISLTNSHGQLVRVIEPKIYEAGKHEVTLDTRELEIGIYFLEIQQGDSSEVRKIILQ